jgi:HK97 family phage major capsid protein
LNPLLDKLQALDAQRVALMAKVDTTDAAGLPALGTEIDAIDAAIAAVRKMEAAAPARPTAPGVTVHDNREDRPFASAGDYMRAVISAGIPGNSVDPRLRPLAATGLNEGVGEHGGFLVEKTTAGGIWQKVYDEGQIISRVTRVPIGPGSNGYRALYVKENARTAGNRHGGIQVYRRAEAGTVTATKPALAEQKLELESAMALVYATDEQMADAPQMNSLVNSLVPKAITFAIEDEIINGNGAGKCLGILNAPSLVSVAKETGQLAATIQAENINKMWSRLHPGSERNAVWLTNKDTQPQLDGMTIGAGAANWPVYLPAGGLSAAPYGSLKGRSVIPVEHCATVGTVGDIMLVDLSQYLLIEKGGIDVATSIHVQFLYAEQVIRFMWRNNGGPLGGWSASAVTPAKGTATQSPFVALATRA